jgi:S-adenosylmethionine:tRNA ribosyltransferase-isomerase
MLTEDFNYNLPAELIAQEPLKKRDSSRLLVLDKESGLIEHKHFYNALDYLKPDDVLVFNDTKVIKARLFAQRQTGAKIEVLLLREEAPHVWRIMLKPAKRVRVGDQLMIASGFTCEILEKNISEGHHLAKFYFEGSLFDALDKYGVVPLPPYIKSAKSNKANDYKENYQTIVAKKPGAIAAPTAGLHFTQELKNKIIEKGIDIETITLHVGYGTFKPVSAEKVADHEIHSEWFDIDEKTAARINKAYKEKRRVIAVGTTVARTLESNYYDNGIKAGEGHTNIYIYPGYEFKAINGLLTNFHLPKSTLLMMISAFAGRESVLNAYEEAIKLKYRFFSFGDAMLIL